jgi:hypothetical protein
MSIEDDLLLLLEPQMGGYDCDPDSDDFEMDREIYLRCRSVGASVRDQMLATEGSGFVGDLLQYRDDAWRQAARYPAQITGLPPEPRSEGDQ